MTESDRDDAPPPAADSPPATEQDAEADDGEAERGKHSMTLLEHLRELRSRLVRCLIAVGVGFLVCYGFVDILYGALIRPLETSMLPNSHMIFTVLYGPFFVQLKIALLAGLMLASPYVFYQIWAFIAPGLYHEERRHIVPLAAVSALFFIAGAACCYLGVLPFAFGFFLSYSTDFVVAQPDIVDYFDFVLKLILAFGLIFEMPLFTLFLTRLGLITATTLRQYRRYAVLGNFVVAAILTPPDPYTLVLMAMPMLALYEISILLAAACGRKPAPETTPDESPDDHPDSTGDKA